MTLFSNTIFITGRDAVTVRDVGHLREDADGTQGPLMNMTI